MVGLSPSVAGSDGFATTLSALLAVLSDPKAAKALLEQLNAKVEEARKQTDTASATIAQAAAQKKELETLQAKLDEGQKRHASRHDELGGRETALTQRLDEVTSKETALAQAKRQFLEDCAEQSKKLQAAVNASAAVAAAATIKLKEDRDEFESSIAAERNRIDSLLREASTKNDEAQQALADAAALKEGLISRTAALKKALGEVR